MSPQSEGPRAVNSTNIVLASLELARFDKEMGMNEVRADGHIVVEKPLVFHGTTAGSITVKATGTLHLFGICRGSLYVHKGGLALIHGIVEKDVFNEGIVELRGRVDGDVNSEGAAFVRLHRGHVLGRTFI